MKFGILFIFLLAVCMAVIPLSALSFSLASPVPASSAQIPEKNLSTTLSDHTDMDNEIFNVREFKIYDETTGEIHTVSVSDYILGAVAAEMPPDFHTEALKAQAVCAHTYALRLKLENDKNPNPNLNGADFSADPSHWSGYVTEEQMQERFGEQFQIYRDKIGKACESAENYLLVYDGNPIVAAYHSISAGKTENASNVWEGSAPYLVPVLSEGDELAPKYETTEIFTAAQTEEILKGLSPSLVLPENPTEWFRDPVYSDSGYLLSVQAGDQTFRGTELRSAFSLRSASFTVSVVNGRFCFQVHGYGHGVGMSQYGADYLARQGKNFEEILLHYYQNAALIRQQ